MTRAETIGWIVATWLVLLNPATPAVVMAEEATPETRVHFNIPRQPADLALTQFAEQANLTLLFPTDGVQERTANELVGEYTLDEAIDILLAETGLAPTFKNRLVLDIAIDDESTVMGEAMDIKKKAGLVGILAGVFAGDVNAQDSSQEPEREKLPIEEIIVTGTNIRGIAPASSPLETYTAEDIERMGATTAAQFIERLPQNLATRSLSGTSAVRYSGTSNQEAIAAVDLRGLGLGTTLVLLNGRRMGLSDFGRAVDVASIPMSAVERVEVLTDGASAIYGSDAVGGVVNFVLRDDFEGAEMRLSYGTVTDGGLHQFNAAQTFGRSWGSGNALLSYDYYNTAPLAVADRDYAHGADAGNLTPEMQRHSLLATISQTIGERLTVNGDAAFSWRDVTAVTAAVFSSDSLDWLLNTSSKNTDQYFANLALDYQILDDLHASFTATVSDTEYSSEGTHIYYNRTPPDFLSPTSSVKDYSIRDLTAIVGGALFALPGGDIRFSLGAGFTDEEYSGAALGVSGIPNRTIGRNTEYAFGELFLPIVSGDQNLPLMHRLELNLAARYTNYSDKSEPALQHEFGDEADPKVGLLWAPTSSLSLRSTYGTSFRAASLSELDETGASNQFIPGVPIPLSGGTPSTLFFVFNLPTPSLKPETAETYTIGFDFRPISHPGLRISGTYYNISYTDRIGTAPQGGAGYLFTPELFPLAIYRPPSVAFIEQIIRHTQNVGGPPPDGVELSDPAAAAQLLFDAGDIWVIDRRFRNLALSEQDGFDISIDSRLDTDWGAVRCGGNVTRIMSYLQQVTPGTPGVSLLDTLTQPVNLRGRIYAGLSRGGFDGALNINYVDDYTAQVSGTGTTDIESWTTADLILSYNFNKSDSGLLDGVRLSLTMQNLFDQDPPFVKGGPTSVVESPIGYDPVNANPLGRFVFAGITKAW